MEELKRRDKKGFAKCIVRLRELFHFGHELRRPAADMLRDGVHELRAKHGHVQYRILYFFHGREAVILAHALVKESAAVPASDIERALARRRRYLANPADHCCIVPVLSEGD